jgi:hypothetical protein
MNQACTENIQCYYPNGDGNNDFRIDGIELPS